MADPYLQDDGQTLRNRLGIVGNPDALQAAETIRVEARAFELRATGLPDARGFDLVKAVHHHLFQDVYEWAGQTRTTPLAKLEHDGGTARTTFTPPERIEREAAELFGRLDRENGLRGLSPESVADPLASYVSALNSVHPFREGNGRTQRIVWEHVAREAGHNLDFEGITRERMVAASIAGTRGDHEPFKRMFGELLDPERRKALVTATRFLAKAQQDGGGLNWNDRYIATTTPGQSYTGQFAGAGGGNFMLGSGARIYVGRLDDLPARGAGLTSGQRISFEARSRTPPAAEPAARYWQQVAAHAPRTAPKTEPEAPDLARGRRPRSG